jgi:three-Cys-motif partner protein
MSEPELYRGREQSLVKHFILRKYLERFAHIVGTFADSITYVDCFSGPWSVRSEDLKDSSFSIALGELRKARETLAKTGKTLKIRCMFLEKEVKPYARLQEFARQIKDAEIMTENNELGGSIDAILRFVKKGGRGTFPFFFIDPTGWTGFEMNLIAPLLKHQPGEVLINFMTDYIRRFIDHPDEPTQRQFAELFGSDKVKDEILALSDTQDREDALFLSYAKNVQQTGGFTHTCSAIILYPEIDRRFFHLIYATRNRRGADVFKHAEQQAMEVQEQTRAEAKQRKRVKKTQQLEFFPAQDMPHSQPIDALRERYLSKAREVVLARIRYAQRVPYEQVWDAALAFPLVWEQDLKQWIKDFQKEGVVKIEGMKPGQRVPKLDANNFLSWQGKTSVS